MTARAVHGIRFAAELAVLLAVFFAVANFSNGDVLTGLWLVAVAVFTGAVLVRTA